MSDIRRLVDGLVTQITALVESETITRARTAVAAAFGKRGPGRPPKALSLVTTGRPRKKGPVQLCPVPGCKNPAAPVFGMVCAEHKKVPRAKIKKYREARKAAKAKTSSKPAKATARKKRKVPTRKPAKAAKRTAPKKPAARPKPAKKRAPRAAPKKTAPKAAPAVTATPPAAAAA